eukprot:gene6081-4376_t
MQYDVPTNELLWTKMNDSTNDIISVSKYFEKVNYPSQPLHDETRRYLNRFFRQDGLIRLCDRIFGKYYWVSELDRRSCWMDTANKNPRGSVAAELFKLLSPGGYFLNLLEAFSTPTFSFSSRVKSPQSFTDIPDDPDSLDVIDFPLASLCLQTTKFLSEAQNADWYDLPRSACPPFMLIPFWVPPLVTRKELSQQRILASLRCKPLPYFLIRMIFYIFSHAECLKGRFFTESNPKRNTVIKFFYQLFESKRCYVTPLMTREMESRKVLEDLSWSSKSITGGMLLCYSYFLSSRCFSETNQECRRCKTFDRSKLANIFGTVPLLNELYISLHRDYKVTLEDQNCLTSLDFSNSLMSRSSVDLINVRRSLYRNCLISIREVLLSLDDIPDCRNESICDVLMLWKSIMNPVWREGLYPCSEYISFHLEAYVYICVDVLLCLSKSNFFRFITARGASTLRECFEILCASSVASQLELGDKLLKGPKASLKFVLNWDRENGNSRLPCIFDKEALHSVVRVRRAFEEVVEEKGCPQLIKSEIVKCQSLLEQVFPGIHKFVASSVHDISTDTYGRKNACGTTGLNHTEEYGLGWRLNIWRNKKKNNHNQEAWAAGDLCRDEVPVLATLSKYSDCFLQIIQELLYSPAVPKCSNGHKMWLLESSLEKCSVHSSTIAMWSCEICGLRYCSDCKQLPLSLTGTSTLECSSNPLTTSSCDTCGKLMECCLPRYENPRDKTIYCPRCASRPYLPNRTTTITTNDLKLVAYEIQTEDFFYCAFCYALLFCVLQLPILPCTCLVP